MFAGEYRKMMGREKGRCTWCNDPVPKGRRRWCGDVCIDAFLLEHSWQHIRNHVSRRDKGVCAQCGCDTEKLRRVLRGVEVYRGNWKTGLFYPRDSILRELGFNPGSALWQADHIIPKYFRGRDHPDNIQTLCVPCHKTKTAADAAKIAKAKRVIKKRQLALIKGDE